MQNSKGITIIPFQNETILKKKPNLQQFKMNISVRIYVCVYRMGDAKTTGVGEGYLN